MRPWVAQVAAAVAGLLGVVDAQGSYGSVAAEQAACPADNFYHLGCFEDWGTFSSSFPFVPETPNPNPSNPSSSFPGFFAGSQYGATVTPLDCAHVCRGHGYRLTALVNGQCYCGTVLPTTLTPVADPLVICNVPCNGNENLMCGGGDAASIYVDSSFADNAEVQDLPPATVAGYYGYLGCYNSPDFPVSDPRVNLDVASVDDCFDLCAQYGYPLVHAEHVGGVVQCRCGTEFSAGNFRLFDGDPNADTWCTVDCDNGDEEACDPTDPSQRCCGKNNIFPIYANPQLMGCYLPVIPGFKTNPDDLFTCYDVPSTLLGPPTEIPQQDVSGLVLIGAEVSLERPPTITTGGNTLYLAGCLDGLLSGLFPVPGEVISELPGTLDLQGCADVCATDPSFVGFAVTDAGSTCECLLTGAIPIEVYFPPEAMGRCSTPCDGDGSVSCGGDGYSIVYSGDPTFGIYGYLDHFDLPQYQCLDGGKFVPSITERVIALRILTQSRHLYNDNDDDRDNHHHNNRGNDDNGN
ncbi:hypothetical protein VTJ49DRAFT_6091 [Mycothermus thermophilus]|uniref:WSC domain-containing protein n=1 Tax=Humicola insolens TaxID=85995 RepID=A0ABR3V1V9_HUMIN